MEPPSAAIDSFSRPAAEWSARDFCAPSVRRRLRRRSHSLHEFWSRTALQRECNDPFRTRRGLRPGLRCDGPTVTPACGQRNVTSDCSTCLAEVDDHQPSKHAVQSRTQTHIRSPWAGKREAAKGSCQQPRLEAAEEDDPCRVEALAREGERDPGKARQPARPEGHERQI